VHVGLSLSLSFSLVMPTSGEGDLAFVVHVLHTKCIKTSVVHETSIFCAIFRSVAAVQCALAYPGMSCTI
jgi:hypothetical protein